MPSAPLAVWRYGLAVLVALLAALVLPSAALADGDPASDVLVSQLAFVPSDTGASTQQGARLLDVLQAARRAGFPIRVAIIPDSYDLGSVTALWGRPRDYARFLGIELSGVHPERLLVVMPNGMGFDWQGHSPTAANGQLAKIPIRAAGGDLLVAAQTAVRGLAASSGIRIAAQTQSPSTKRAASGGATAAILIGVVAAALAAVALLALRRRSTRRRRPVQEAVPAGPTRPTSPIRPRWVVPGFALLACLAAGIPILALVLLRHPGGTPAVAETGVATPFEWAAGQRPAPAFRLTDQDGRRITLAAFRGRPVIVTFIDPLCRNLCPLAAHVLNQVDATLPASQRPAIIAVSVDIYADTRADLLQDFHKWDLVPQWHWAVGKPRQLAAVWKAYKIGVLDTTKRIAGTTVHYITHDEVAYVVDPSGNERALFVWPYYPEDVEHLVRGLERGRTI
jgi:cytochrome oxidase Cu insertion factor (SCO1/SenC/PrrC family)